MVELSLYIYSVELNSINTAITGLTATYSEVEYSQCHQL